MGIRRVFVTTISAGGKPYVSSFTVDGDAYDPAALVAAFQPLANGLVVSVSEALQYVRPSDRFNPLYVTQTRLDAAYDSQIAKGYIYSAPDPINEPEHRIRALTYLEGVNANVLVGAEETAEDKLIEFLTAYAGIGPQSLTPTGAILRLVPQGV